MVIEKVVFRRAATEMLEPWRDSRERHGLLHLHYWRLYLRQGLTMSLDGRCLGRRLLLLLLQLRGLLSLSLGGLVLCNLVLFIMNEAAAFAVRTRPLVPERLAHLGLVLWMSVNLTELIERVSKLALVPVSKNFILISFHSSQMDKFTDSYRHCPVSSQERQSSVLYREDFLVDNGPE